MAQDREGTDSNFTGFPAGKLRYTPIPDVFFSHVLPTIDNLAEVKVTLHILWQLYRKRNSPRTITRTELLANGDFIRGLGGADAFSEGLHAAVRRGTLIRLALDMGQGNEHEEAYVANSQEGRRIAERMAAGELRIKSTLASPAPKSDPPNIFALYEQIIGLLSPIIADELREAEKTYSAEWIVEAFHIAAEQNVRKWIYVRRILERWAAEGKDDEANRQNSRTSGRSYIEGKYADFIQH
jgi:DNA replication protein